MFCSNCGTEIPSGTNTCPNCGYTAEEIPTVEAVPVESETESKRKFPSRGSKNYAAIMTALLVFPASFCTAIDLSFHRYDFWFGYIVGLLLVTWVCVVFPALKLTPAPVTALICVTSVFGYLSFIMYKTGHFLWIYQRALPLFVLFLFFLWLTVYLVSADKLKGFAILSLICFEIGTYIVAIEATATGSLGNLHWSPIVSCGFVSLAALFLALNYVSHNKE